MLGGRVSLLGLVIAVSASEVDDESWRDLSCTPQSRFTRIDFQQTTILHSNLGGIGGRCHSATGWFDQDPNACDQVETSETPHEIYLRRVGENLDLRITVRLARFKLTAAA